MKRVLFLLCMMAGTAYGQKQVSYTVISENPKKRFDHAKHFIVVTHSINPAKDDYKGITQYIINKIAAKGHTRKFSVDIFDDMATGNLYKHSHYGEGTAIMSKSQLNQIGLHEIASYVGELAVDGVDPYEIDYYLGAEKGTPMFKYRKGEIFKPTL